jgi:hypothetical protein
MMSFRRMVIAGLCAASLLAGATDASAHVYKCTARSPVAFGWFISHNLAVSRYNALRQCAIRTPRGLACLIRSCVRV